MDWLTPQAAYIHVPFCAHHCGYCDFAVAAGQDHLIELYLDALAIEMRGEGTPIETIFIGGGTPTHLNLSQLQLLMKAIGARFRGAAEFSIESTPESLDAEKVKLLAENGVTRISVGVQSFELPTLNALDRQHGVEQIHRAIAAVRGAGLGLSLDLIFGAPGQTLASWNRDLAAAIALAPDHISTYGLTYEKGTPLWKRWSRGEVKDVGEDLELAMYESSIDALAAAGFEHYEISNFARPGQRCRHNERYWANHAYFGFGVGAARYVSGSREIDVRDTKLYIQRVLAGESPTQSSERLPPRERAFETMAVQLRRIAGIDRASFCAQTGFALDALIPTALPHFVEEGLLLDDGASVKLSRRGMAVADGIIEKMMMSR